MRVGVGHLFHMLDDFCTQREIFFLRILLVENAVTGIAHPNTGKQVRNIAAVNGVLQIIEIDRAGRQILRHIPPAELNVVATGFLNFVTSFANGDADVIGIFRRAK